MGLTGQRACPSVPEAARIRLSGRMAAETQPQFPATGELDDGTCQVYAFIRWDEKAGLQRDAIRSQ